MTKSRDENSNVSNAPKVGELEANREGLCKWLPYFRFCKKLLPESGDW